MKYEFCQSGEKHAVSAWPTYLVNGRFWRWRRTKLQVIRISCVLLCCRGSGATWGSLVYPVQLLACSLGSHLHTPLLCCRTIPGTCCAALRPRVSASPPGSSSKFFFFPPFPLYSSSTSVYIFPFFLLLFFILLFSDTLQPYKRSAQVLCCTQVYALFFCFLKKIYCSSPGPFQFSWVSIYTKSFHSLVKHSSSHKSPRRTLQ